MMVLKINDRFRNRRVYFFNDFTVDMKFNSCASAFSLRFRFDEDNPEHKELGAFTHFHECTLEYNGELLITGNVLCTGFLDTAKADLCTLTGYSKPGVLEDCTIPPSLYPLQSDGLTLRQIAQKLIKPFELEMVVAPSVSARMDKVFKKTVAEATQTVRDYLTELASQKDIVLSHDEYGRLLFTEAIIDQVPAIDFDRSKGMVPGTSFDFNFNGQGMHSHIHVQKEADVDGGNAGESMVRNPYVVHVYRPIVINQSSGDDNDTVLAAKRALANELRGLTYAIGTDRWLVNNKIVRPNIIVSVINPVTYIFKKVEFFVESVVLTGNEDRTVATLNCVLKDVYSKETPVSIISGINIVPL